MYPLVERQRLELPKLKWAGLEGGSGQTHQVQHFKIMATVSCLQQRDVSVHSHCARDGGPGGHNGAKQRCPKDLQLEKRRGNTGFFKKIKIHFFFSQEELFSTLPPALHSRTCKALSLSFCNMPYLGMGFGKYVSLLTFASMTYFIFATETAEKVCKI